MSDNEDISEISLTVGLLGANHQITKLVGEALGTPGQQSDLQFFNRLDLKLHIVFTAVAPIGYPDKIKSLIQACAITEIHVMCIDCETGITPEIGEIMVLMDLFAQHYQTQYLAVIGGINSSNEWRKEEILAQLQKLTHPTKLRGIEVISLGSRPDYEHLKERLYSIGSNSDIHSKSKDESEEVPVKVLVDHVFPVKGIGTVLLGLVKSGIVRAGEMYNLAPGQTKVILRSIQKFDRDFKVAYIGDRVGLALKGMKSPDLDRNTVFCSVNSMKQTDSAIGTFTVSPFYKPQHPSGKISPEDTRNYHLVADLAITPVKLVGGDSISPGKSGSLELKLDKPLAHDDQGLKGILADFGPFTKKLRIVGYFQQK
ncbi:MAG: hypothetical protein ACTSVZ_03325, partial [Promethearchaeota archaeon]